MKCEFCNNEFISKTSLIHHQKTAKYCILLQGIDKNTNFVCLKCNKKLSTQNRLYTHEQTCKKHMEDIIRKECEQKLIEKDKIILERDLLISEQKIIIKELHADYKKQIDMQNKDFHDRMQSMAEKAIDKPSTVTKNNTTQIINNLLPITPEHLNEQVQFLTKEHVTNGAVGYAKYALEFPLKDRLVCTDSSRKKGKYKDSDGNIVSDPEMTSITRKLFSAIKDRNAALIDEHALDLKVKLDQFNCSDNNEMDENDSIEFSSVTDQLIDYITAAYSQKRQSREMSEGLKPELFQEFVKELSSGCFRCK
jgi:hypothetical protein